MEQDNKNQISALLLVVGVIFILIAGSIFVTTAWQYLPQFVKQLTLLAVVAGLFAGSNKASKGGRLQKTEMALFYLGVAFTGFFVLAAMGGLVDDGVSQQMNALKVLMASIAMLVPVGIRLAVRKRGFEYSVAAVLVDGILIWLTGAMELKFTTYALLYSVLLLLLATVDYYQRKEGVESRGLELSISIVYLVHAVVYLLVAGGAMLMTNWSDSVLPILFALVPLLITGITYLAEKQMVYRILNSMAILWLVFVSCANLNCMLSLTKEIAMALLAAFTINMLIMLFVKRKELQMLWVGVGLLIPFVQWFTYVISWNTIHKYYPFSFVFAIGALLLYLKLKYIENEEDICGRYGWIAFLQVLTGMVMWVAAKGGEMPFPICNILLVITLVITAFWAQDQSIKSVLWTVALFFGEVAAWTQSSIQISDMYRVEWHCVLLGLGIVLLRFIWYDSKEDVDALQFVATCGILGMLLLHNLVSGELGNVLFLGMVSIVILLVAAVKNQKKYVIASSVTLILLVLYLTRSFWLSIAWWVYLFVAGVVLVLLAIKKERES